ncbi:hypothetical protein I552_0027 [Mycobacterium xenopi 3993]|nr:hypothetical protein I552_0027 [Mycobacterium xenopi 3993]
MPAGTATNWPWVRRLTTPKSSRFGGPAVRATGTVLMAIGALGAVPGGRPGPHVRG